MAKYYRYKSGEEFYVVRGFYKGQEGYIADVCDELTYWVKLEKIEFGVIKMGWNQIRPKNKRLGLFEWLTI